MVEPGNDGLAETRQILIRALDGDLHARGDLMERLRPRLVLWVSTRLSPKIRAVLEPEDVAQEILLSLHKYLESYRGSDNRAFYAWLFRIAENRIRDLVDHHTALKRRPTPAVAVSQTTPGTAMIRSEQLDAVRRAVERLPDDYREVIRLRRLEERDVSEVAGIMGRSENAVRVLFCRALKALREEMTKKD